MLRRRHWPLRAGCGSCPAWQGCVGRWGWEVVVEEVGHMVVMGQQNWLINGGTGSEEGGTGK